MPVTEEAALGVQFQEALYESNPSAFEFSHIKDFKNYPSDPS